MNPLSPSLPADTRTANLHEQISLQAQQLWEGYGRPQGRDVPIWLEAERQVLGADPQVNAASGGGSTEAAQLKESLTPTSPPASTPDGQKRTTAGRERIG